MAGINYDQLITRIPDGEVVPPIMNRQIPSMTMISDALVPGAKNYMEGGWIYNMPVPNPGVYEMVHKGYDELVMLIGSDPKDPDYLGAEIDFYVAGQPITINKTAAMFVPAGVPHGPLVYKKIDGQWPYIKPHFMTGIMIGAGSLMEAWGDSGVAEPKKEMPKKTDDKDYSVLAPKKNVREVGQGLKNRTSITLMNSEQVPQAYSYINLSWIHDIPETDPKEHAHDYNELLVHLGGNPFRPFDLGAEIEFELGGKQHMLNTTSSVWLPKGVKQGPMKWKKLVRPHIELSIIFDCGDKKKIYGDMK
jgi:hypothetical protein